MSNSIEDDLATARTLINEERFEAAIAIMTPHAEAGVAEAEGEVGVLMMLGLGTERNLVRARRLLESAANRGYGAAAHNLGTLYLDRSYPAWDFDESRKWYDRAKALGFIVGTDWP